MRSQRVPFGSLATFLFAVLIRVKNLVSHILTTGLSFVIALAAAVAIDWPYCGNDGIGPDRLAELQASLKEREVSASSELLDNLRSLREEERVVPSLACGRRFRGEAMTDEGTLRLRPNPSSDPR